MTLGRSQPNEYWLTINEVAEPLADKGGTVRLTTHIKYGQGMGIRFCDLTLEQAEALGVELIQAAQQASDKVHAVHAALDAATARALSA